MLQQLGASMTDWFVGDWTPAAPLRHFCCAKHCHAHATPFPVNHHHSLLSSITHCLQQSPLRRDWVSTHCPPRQASLSPEDKQPANFVGRLRLPTPCPLPTQLPTVPCPWCISAKRCPASPSPFLSCASSCAMQESRRKPTSHITSPPNLTTKF